MTAVEAVCVDECFRHICFLFSSGISNNIQHHISTQKTEDKNCFCQRKLWKNKYQLEYQKSSFVCTRSNFSSRIVRPVSTLVRRIRERILCFPMHSIITRVRCPLIRAQLNEKVKLSFKIPWQFFFRSSLLVKAVAIHSLQTSIRDSAFNRENLT